MTTRISALADVDPLSVPLPHGTEVTLRVERLLHGKRVPQGLVGRVVRARDGGFDVLVTGIGELWYERAELAPRRLGQLHFAQRREAAWQALHGCRVLEATVGSQAWGLADEKSDTDVRGAFALPFSWTGGLAEPPVDLVSADGSATYWEVRKLVEQALRADPNTLELLFVPSVKALDEIGQWVLDAREAFVSKLLFGSFGRYALSQLDKLSASQRLAEHRDLVLEWLREEPAPPLDELARRLALKTDAKSDEAAVHAARTRLKQLYRSLWDQGLLESNDLDGLTAYARGGGRRPPDARSLRPKNAYNLLRLIELARGWLETGTPTFAATGDFRQTLLSIKRGELELDEVLRRAEAMSPALEAARDGSKLPEQPDFERADALLRRIHAELARRHVIGVPWPRGAPASDAELAPGSTPGALPVVTDDTGGLAAGASGPRDPAPSLAADVGAPGVSARPAVETSTSRESADVGAPGVSARPAVETSTSRESTPPFAAVGEPGLSTAPQAGATTSRESTHSLAVAVGAPGVSTALQSGSTSRESTHSLARAIGAPGVSTELLAGSSTSRESSRAVAVGAPGVSTAPQAGATTSGESSRAAAVDAPAAHAAWSHFTPHQRVIAERALAVESSRRAHVVISLSGAHAYGFPSPDSDLDLKAVHLAPTRSLLGFTANVPPAERLEVIEGVEIDYSSNELGGVLQGVLKGNGNYLERFLSGFTLGSGHGFDALVPLVQAALSARLARHYFGFATQQRAAWDQGGRASAKKLLYVLRTLLTGAHALLEGEVVTDLAVLAPKYELGDALELIAQKRRGEKSELPAALADAWAARVDSVFALLARAERDSALPAEPPASAARALEEALIALRSAAE